MEIEKTFGGRPRTTVRLSDQGRTTVSAHWDRLMRLHEAAGKWTGDES